MVKRTPTQNNCINCEIICMHSTCFGVQKQGKNSDTKAATTATVAVVVVVKVLNSTRDNRQQPSTNSLMFEMYETTTSSQLDALRCRKNHGCGTRFYIAWPCDYTSCSSSYTSTGLGKNACYVVEIRLAQPFSSGTREKQK